MTWPRLAPAIGLLLATVACSGAQPQGAAYTFKASDSPVKVDTPQLRALKAATHIAPCPTSAAGTEGVPGGLPDMTLPCLGGGRSVDLAGLRGPLLVNFWAQWCGPCRDESPLLQKFAATANGAVKVVAVDFYDPMPSRAIEFAKELGLTYPQLADPAEATKAPLHIAGLPVTFFVNAAGKVTFTQVGPITSESVLAHLVKTNLGVSVPTATAGSTGSGS